MAELIWTAPMHYYSRSDEAAFFGWLQSIPGVTGIRGQGHELVIRLKSKKLSQTALRELLALYRRYGGDMSELEQFANDTNRSWFQNPDAYWYNAVFASQR
ncbi:hypothetical protein Q4S45_19490 [Massilia sp. R2A-15]|uniref:hypothetical protein n=1 Tax=Massilia sp. R2A-15 TaxID=3064278 RepID=UPI0027342651|nr:hypothetical protein [Massilia sp. R2A-15]WLI88864.1 hypothetical protein Q4S45_19490 [Massilia sp. R2A-15]